MLPLIVLSALFTWSNVETVKATEGDLPYSNNGRECSADHYCIVSEKENDARKYHEDNAGNYFTYPHFFYPVHFNLLLFLRFRDDFIMLRTTYIIHPLL